MKKIILLSLIGFYSCEDTEAPKGHSEEQHHNRQPSSERVYYDFSDSILKKAISPFDDDPSAIAYSNIGNYFSALEVFERHREPSANASVIFDTLNIKTLPAIEYIAKQAKQNRVVIINEAHHVSYHRFFSLLLLKKLSTMGFNYFGAETLSHGDSLLNQRGYPTLNSGFYTSEPQYGNLIREAISSNYKVFAYETTQGKNNREREIEQARNIEKILKADPNAKILIHCGYSHLLEGPVEGWGKAMAGWLREYTGIDPLTIDQVELTEHFKPEHENPFYKQMNYTDFVVFETTNNTLLPKFRNDNNQSDIFVYHPRTHLKYNRPHWLFDYYSPNFIAEKITIKFPVLVKAYLETDDVKEAVPVDIVEIDKQSDSTALAILPGKSYKLLVENAEKEQQLITLKTQNAKVPITSKHKTKK